MTTVRREWPAVAARRFGWRLDALAEGPWGVQAMARARARDLDLETLAEDAAAGEPRATSLLAEVVSVDETYFLREPHALEEALTRFERGRPLRIWNAGCSSGEETYTLAALAESAGHGSTCSVLGTDINGEALKEAMTGRYPLRSLRGPHFERAGRYFPTVGGRVCVPESVRARVEFKLHNLMDPRPPRSTPFDLVVCRNVLVYFNAAASTQVQLRLAAALCPGGVLVTSPMDSAGPPQGLLPVSSSLWGVFQKALPLPIRVASSRKPGAVPAAAIRPKGPALPSPLLREQAPGHGAQALGMALLDEGQFSSARASFKEALTLNDRLPLAWLGVALSHVGEGEFVQALPAAQRALETVRGRAAWEGVPGAEDEVTAGQIRALAANLLERSP